MNRHTIDELRQKQGLPLRAKILLTKQLIREWYDHWDGDVCVNFSGGKDSTVLLHIVRQVYPYIPAVFVDTGLEFPEVREHVKTIKNVEIIRPEKNFRQVIAEEGWVFPSKDVAHTIYYARQGLCGQYTGLKGKLWTERRHHSRKSTI